jgi:hypothetical protein
VAASANAAHTTGFIIGAAVAGLLICLLLLLDGIRRIHRNLEPSEERAEFTDTLQVANGEDEAHQLLRHHLERTLPGTSAVVLNRNNSADRLEAVTPLPGGSPLAQTLRGAEPRSCLAVRTGQTHRENERRAPLLSCPVCASCPGASACVPLTVGGEEFAILLPDTELPMALEIAERVRLAIAEISLPGTDVSVTASIGVSGFPDHASTLERLADAALYVAKRQGRNRVEVAEPGTTDPASFVPGPADESGSALVSSRNGGAPGS